MFRYQLFEETGGVKCQVPRASDARGLAKLRRDPCSQAKAVNHHTNRTTFMGYHYSMVILMIINHGIHGSMGL